MGLKDSWHIHEVFSYYDLIKNVPCPKEDCGGYLKPNGVPIDDEKWSGDAKYPCRCEVCGIRPTIALSMIKNNGTKMTWKEIVYLKNFIRTSASTVRKEE